MRPSEIVQRLTDSRGHTTRRDTHSIVSSINPHMSFIWSNNPDYFHHTRSPRTNYMCNITAAKAPQQRPNSHTWRSHRLHFSAPTQGMRPWTTFIRRIRRHRRIIVILNAKLNVLCRFICMITARLFVYVNARTHISRTTFWLRSNSRLYINILYGWFDCVAPIHEQIKTWSFD